MSTSFYERLRIPGRLATTLMMNVRAEGLHHLPKEGGVLLVSNHLCLVDPPLLGILFTRQLHFMAKEELFRFKPLEWLCYKAGTFPVKRGESDRVALRHAEGLLKAGKVVMIFPEGHRSDSAGAQAARTGAVLLATRAQCPILPVGIAGTEHLRLKPINNDSPWTKFSWPQVQVRVGHPLHIEAKGGQARQHAADTIMQHIMALVPPSYHGIYAEKEQVPDS